MDPDETRGSARDEMTDSKTCKTLDETSSCPHSTTTNDKKSTAEDITADTDSKAKMSVGSLPDDDHRVSDNNTVGATAGTEHTLPVSDVAEGVLADESNDTADGAESHAEDAAATDVSQDVDGGGEQKICLNVTDEVSARNKSEKDGASNTRELETAQDALEEEVADTAKIEQEDEMEQMEHRSQDGSCGMQQSDAEADSSVVAVGERTAPRHEKTCLSENEPFDNYNDGVAENNETDKNVDGPAAEEKVDSDYSVQSGEQNEEKCPTAGDQDSDIPPERHEKFEDTANSAVQIAAEDNGLKSSEVQKSGAQFDDDEHLCESEKAEQETTAKREGSAVNITTSSSTDDNSTESAADEEKGSQKVRSHEVTEVRQNDYNNSVDITRENHQRDVDNDAAEEKQEIPATASTEVDTTKPKIEEGRGDANCGLSVEDQQENSKKKVEDSIQGAITSGDHDGDDGDTVQDDEENRRTEISKDSLQPDLDDDGSAPDRSAPTGYNAEKTCSDTDDNKPVEDKTEETSVKEVSSQENQLAMVRRNNDQDASSEIRQDTAAVQSSVAVEGDKMAQDHVETCLSDKDNANVAELVSNSNADKELGDKAKEQSTVFDRYGNKTDENNEISKNVVEPLTEEKVDSDSVQSGEQNEEKCPMAGDQDSDIPPERHEKFEDTANSAVTIAAEDNGLKSSEVRKSGAQFDDDEHLCQSDKAEQETTAKREGSAVNITTSSSTDDNPTESAADEEKPSLNVGNHEVTEEKPLDACEEDQIKAKNVLAASQAVALGNDFKQTTEMSSNTDEKVPINTDLEDENSSNTQSNNYAGESLLERTCHEELLEFATCPSCQTVKADIKILPCMDSCCLQCLQQLSQHQHSSHEMNCPSCTQTFPVPQQGWEELPSNIYIRPLLSDPYSIERAASYKDKQQTLRCCACNKKAKLKYCKECCQHLCQNCVIVHGKLRSTRIHHVVGQRQCVLVDCDSVLCKDHPSKSLQAYCSDCQRLCCVLCLQHVHHDHNWTDVDQVSEAFSQRLNSDAKSARNAASSCEEWLQLLEGAEEMMSKKVKSIESEIDWRKKVLIDAINSEFESLCDELSRAENNNIKRIQRDRERLTKQKKILQSFDRFCQTTIDSGTTHELIHVYNNLHIHDEEFPLQHVSCTVDIPQLGFTPVNVYDWLPEHAQQLIGSVSVGQTNDESSTEEPTWKQIRDDLVQSVQQVAHLHEQANDNQQTAASLREQLTEKTELLKKTTKELEQKTSLIDELQRQTSELTNAIKEKESFANSLAELLQQKEREYALTTQTLHHQIVDAEKLHKEQMCDSRLREQQMSLDKTTLELQESKRNAAEYQATIDQLNARVDLLEASLSDSMNKEDQLSTQLQENWQQISEQSILIEHVPPIAVKVCSLCGQDVAPVYGVAAVGHRLFLIRAWSTDVEVYEASTFCFLNHLSVPGLLDVTDMTGCEHYRCLYLADSNSRIIHTVGLLDRSVSGQWRVRDKPYGVSVSSDCHVVVAFSETSSVGIYTFTGDQQRLISVTEHVVNLRHAVVLETGQLVICHGTLQHDVGVSIIDAEGHVVKTLLADIDSQLGWPTHVAVDKRGFIYVTDYTEKQVRQLDSDLSYVATIVGYDEGLRNPRSICVNSSTRRMYVAELGGNVLVFGLA